MGNKLQTTVLIARWMQVLTGLALIITCSFGTFYTSVYYYGTSGSSIIFSATAACSSYLIPAGGVGFVRFYSPESVHWRLGLALDIIVLILSAVSWGLPIVLLFDYLDYPSFSCTAAAISLAGVAFFFSIFPIIETSRLKKMGRLTRSKAGIVEGPHHDWFHMEEGNATQRPQQQSSVLQTSPPQHQRVSLDDDVISSSAFQLPQQQQHQEPLRQVVEEDDIDIEALPVRSFDEVVDK